MSALTSVIKWTTELPLWQADAIRRFLTQEKLLEQDFEELYAAFKIDTGLTNALPEEMPKLLAPTIDSISGANIDSTPISLISITCENNVNAIPNGTEISFGHSGAILIYGENGTGKSGFARVLKRACKAKDQSEPILGNAYSGLPETDIKVKFGIIEGGIRKSISWKQGDQSVSDLAKITVFDSRCARVILDKKNEFQYNPYGTQVFEQLSDLIAKFKTKLTSELPKASKPVLADLKDSTVAKIFYDTLSANTLPVALKAYEFWSPEEDAELEKLRQWYKDHSGNGYELKIKNIKTLISRHYSAITALRRFNNTLKSLSEKYYSCYENHQVNHDALKIANEMIADGTFPLPGIMSATWKSLFLAALEYSTKHAYKDLSAPNTDSDSRCVLCMQVLDADAKYRFNKFNEFIKSKANENYEKSKAELAKVKNDISKLQSINRKFIQPLIAEFSAENEQHSEELLIFSDTLNEILRNLQANSFSSKQVNLGSSCSLDRQSLMKWLKVQKAQMLVLINLQDPKQFEQNVARGRELGSKKTICDKFVEISGYVDSLRLIKQLQDAMIKLDTRHITAKNKAIINETSTPALKVALQSELDSLSCSRLIIGIKASGASGQVTHGLELTGSNGKFLPSAILSEGEQKAVSIAGFFAELTVANHSNPIVFDDPVTSVDHIFKSKIAKRIAQECVNRQVIVFTHDISFLFELERFLDSEMGVTKQVVTLKRKNNIPGHISELTWHAMKSKDRIKYLKAQIVGLKSLYASDTEIYDKEASFWYSQFRETWESIIEDALLNGTIQRFGNSIKTQSLREVEVSDADYILIEKFMGKSSEWMVGHDRSKELSAHRPPPVELESDLAETEKFTSEIVKRRDAIGKQRKQKLSTPIQTNIG